MPNFKKKKKKIKESCSPNRGSKIQRESQCNWETTGKPFNLAKDQELMTAWGQAPMA